MAIDDTVNLAIQERPGLLRRAGGWLSRTASKAVGAVKYGSVALAGLAAMAVAVNRADASPINPLIDVHSASPTATVAIDTASYGNGTGAGGNTLSNTWYISTNKNNTGGRLLEMNGQNFVRAINVGMALTGVDVNPDGSLVLSSGTSLYEGRVDAGGAWQETRRIDLGKITNDVCTGYGMADFFVATTEGVYAIRNGVLGEKVDNGIYRAYDAVKLDSSKYTSNLAIGEAVGNKEANSMGVTFGPGKLIGMDLDDLANGLANIKDGQMVVEPDAFQVYLPQGYWGGIETPEPATIFLMTAGGMYLLTRRKEQKE